MPTHRPTSHAGINPQTSSEEIAQLIRMAQVLKMRCGLLADSLGALKCGPQAGAARIASDDAHNAASRLIKISTELNRASP